MKNVTQKTDFMDKNFIELKNNLSSNILTLTVVHSKYAQRIITGKVTDVLDGNPIPHVAILDFETTNKTFTDFDGCFALKVCDNDILGFSFLGYETKIVSAGTSGYLHVILKR